MAVEEWQVPLWDAINRYVVACGGDPSKRVYGNTPRMNAVGEVNTVVRESSYEARLFRAQSAVHRYMVALGPHLSDSWKDLLVEECGLEIDEGDPYRHPKRPVAPVAR